MVGKDFSSSLIYLSKHQVGYVRDEAGGSGLRDVPELTVDDVGRKFPSWRARPCCADLTFD